MAQPKVPPTTNEQRHLNATHTRITRTTTRKAIAAHWNLPFFFSRRCTVEVTERCGFSDQRQFACRAAELQGLARREALRNPAMLLIRNPLEAQQTDAVLRVV